MEIKKRKYNILDTLKIPFTCNWLISLEIAIISIITGIIPTIQTVIVAKFIDVALKVIYKETVFLNVIPWIVLIIVLITILWFSKILTSYLQKKLVNSLREIFRIALVEKRSKLQYQSIENPKTWDLITRISDKAEERLASFYCDIFDFFALILRIMGLIILLFTNIWWVALVVVIFSVPTTVYSIKSGQQTYEIRQNTQQFHRRYEYFATLLTSREAAEERNVFGFGEEIVSKWHYYYEKARKMEVREKMKWYIKMKLGGIATSLILILVTIVLINPVLSGAITVGIFMSLVNSTFLLVDNMTWNLTRYTEQIANNVEYMKDFSIFAQMDEINKEETGNIKQIEFHTLEFKDVRFRYPQTENYILNGLSFKISKGKRYAIVGINGAGKTTITKLLTGLYDNYEGYIYLNGRELRKYTKKEINVIFSSVYQDFAKYFISIKDNILLGDIEKISNYSQKKLFDIVEKVGLEDLINSLPDGLETKLGKIYAEGKDISGGQWQRVAIARTLYSTAQVFILDEPTASLDPVSETDIYKEFDQMSYGMTTILISHRLSSTKLVDEIVVLNNGKVEELGKHDELMRNKGLYYSMYESQRKWYE